MAVNLSSVDLRLLVLFDALMSERSVSRAAMRTGMSQPAASNALNRLRHMLDDRLFVRSADGMKPTMVAMRLAGPLGEALRKLQLALEPASFDPGKSTHAFRLAVSDHASVVFLPKLLVHLKRLAPSVALQIQPKTNAEVEAVLDAAEIDLAIGVIPTLPSRFRRMKLFDDAYVMLMREDHPLSRRELTLKRLKEARCLAVRPAHSTASGIDALLRRAGVYRRIDLTVTQFLAAPEIIRRTDLVASMFQRMTESFDASGLAVRTLPFLNERIDVCAVWTKVGGENPAHQWLRRQLEAVGKNLAW